MYNIYTYMLLAMPGYATRRCCKRRHADKCALAGDGAAKRLSERNHQNSSAVAR